MKKVVAGFDPGGQGNFGWCVVELESMQVICKGVVDYANAALRKAREAIDDAQLVAVGIDAPLYWTRKGDSRVADEKVRHLSGASSGTVQAVNSLRGACLIQGFFLAKAIESEYPDCVITETHPKALMLISPKAKEFGESHKGSDHERDALISAWAAAQCYGGGGQNLFCLDNEKDVHVFLKKTMYWWTD